MVIVAMRSNASPQPSPHGEGVGFVYVSDKAVKEIISAAKRRNLILLETRRFLIALRLILFFISFHSSQSQP